MSPESLSGCIITDGAYDREAMKNHGQFQTFYFVETKTPVEFEIGFSLCRRDESVDQI